MYKIPDIRYLSGYGMNTGQKRGICKADKAGGKSILRTYDKNSHLLSETGYDGIITEYTCDIKGNLESVSRGGQLQASYTAVNIMYQNLGRRPIGIETMLRMYLMQKWFNLSDEGIEDSIYDSYAMRSFMHIDFMNSRYLMQPHC